MSKQESTSTSGTISPDFTDASPATSPPKTRAPTPTAPEMEAVWTDHQHNVPQEKPEPTVAFAPALAEEETTQTSKAEVRSESQQTVKKTSGKGQKTPRKPSPKVIQVTINGKQYSVLESSLGSRQIRLVKQPPKKPSATTHQQKPQKQKQKQKPKTTSSQNTKTPKKNKGKEKAEQPTIRSVVQNAASYSVMLWKDDPTTMKRAQQLGINSRASAVPNGPHPLDAARRELMIVKAISALYSAGHQQILSLYGCERDAVIASRLNQKVPGPEQVAVYPICTVDMVSNHLAPKDAYRKALQKTPVLKGSKAAILVDVYWITPDIITTLMADLQLEAIIWVGKSHLAPFGCNYGETTWYRVDEEGNLSVTPDSSDLIISRASGSEPRTEPHPCCDWLFRENFEASGSKFLTWAVVETPPEGVWHTVFFSRNDAPPVCPSTMPYMDLMETIDIPASLFDTSYLGPIRRSLDRFIGRKRPTLIYKPLYKYLSLYNFGKNRNAYTFQSISAAAREWAKDDRAFDALLEEFTDLAQDLLLNTVHAAFWKNLPREEAYLTGITGEMATTVNRYHNSRKRLDKPLVDPTSRDLTFRDKTGFILAGALAAYFAIQATKIWRWLRSSEKRPQPGSLISFVTHYVKKKMAEHSKTGAFLQQIILDKLRKSGWLSVIDKITATFKRFMWRPDYWAVCFVAPVAEEAIKAHGWMPTLGLMLTEALIVHARFGIKNYIPTAVMHILAKLCSQAGYNKTAVFIHSAWNHYAYTIGDGITQPGSLVHHMGGGVDIGTHKEWVESYYYTPWNSRPKIEDEEKGIYPIVNPSLPRQVESYTSTEFKPCPVVKMEYYGSADKINREPGLVAGYLIPNFPLYAPARSVSNVMAALKYRLLQAAPGDSKTVEASWMRVPDLKFVQRYSEIDRDEVWQQYWDHLETAQRKQRATRAHEAALGSHYSPTDRCFNKTSYFVKTNEKLIRIENGYPAMKPRGIILLQPEAVDSIGPALFEVTKRLKKEHSLENPPVYKFGNRRVRISYASSATAEGLTAWLSRARAWVRRAKRSEERFWAIVAGDDGFIVTGDSVGFLYLETDFSQFDQSEGKYALRYQRRQQRRLGLSRKDADCEKRIGNATITCSVGRLRMYERFWRATGEGATTHGNCIVHEGAILFVFSTGGLDGMADRYLSLGFKVKMRLSRSLSRVSFLKGWWLPSPGARHIWTILPSRVLKIGQHLGNPCHIRGYSKDLYTACRQHACAVAKTYAAFPWSPVVGEYVAKWKDQYPKVPAWHLDSWRVSSKHPYRIDREAANMAAATRYGVSVEDVIELGEIYRTVDVMTFIKHPLFMRMAVTDY